MIVYLDHNATTPVRPEVVDAMLPFLGEFYGNPNSAHGSGQAARKVVEDAREKVAALIGAADASEIVFTSCGSESDAAAVIGGAEAVRRGSGGRRNRVVTSVVEHGAVEGSVRELAARGFEAVFAAVDQNAVVDAAQVERAIAPETALVSIMAANNEIGSLQPIGAIAAACRARGVLFHTDAVQAVGKIPIDVRALGVDLLALSGHKINAPKGVGALYIRKGVRLVPLIPGKQELNRRGGTENAASIVALGVAAELAMKDMSAHGERLRRLRDRLERRVLALPDARLTGNPAERLPGTSHLCFRGVDGHRLVVGLDLEDVCVSSGPACHSGAAELSPVLKAMGVADEWGRGALRVSLGWGSTEADVDRFAAVLERLLPRLRESVSS